jgi:hypothetical protein
MVFISASGVVGEGCDPTVIPTFGQLQCFVKTVCTRKPWWSNPRHKLTPIARCFTGLSLPHPPKPLSNKQTEKINILDYVENYCQLNPPFFKESAFILK